MLAGRLAYPAVLSSRIVDEPAFLIRGVGRSAAGEFGHAALKRDQAVKIIP
jgi:hypothetical protein